MLRHSVHALAAIIALAAAQLTLSACASGGSARAPSATGGLAMTMFVRDATKSEVYYEVDEHGTLGYGGGLSARMGTAKWTGPLTPEEIQQLRDLLAQQDWFKAKPQSTLQPPEHLYRVSIAAPENSVRITVKGENEKVEPIREQLATAALRRQNEDLKQLPLPSSHR